MTDTDEAETHTSTAVPQAETVVQPQPEENVKQTVSTEEEKTVVETGEPGVQNEGKFSNFVHNTLPR